MAITGWPAGLDDIGNGQSGLELDKAYFDAVEAAIEAYIVSGTNPTITPADIIDEVVDARGSKATLDSRLDVALNDDGTLKSQAGLVTQDQAKSILGRNGMVANDDFRLWPDGDTDAPACYTLSGTGAVIQRCGTGLVDTARKVGDFCARITYGSASAKLTQQLLPAAAFSRADFMKGVKVGFGCWIYTASPSQARVVCDDGSVTTATDFHTGGASWEFLSSVHTIDTGASKLDIYVEVAGAGSAYFDGLTLIVSDIAPLSWVSCPIQAIGSLYIPVPGDASVFPKKGFFFPARPGIVLDFQLRAETPPTGAALIVDLGAHSGNEAALGACTTAVGAAGALTGAYYYKITAIDADGNESILGTISAVVNPAAQQVDLTNIPLGPAGTVDRGVFRTKAGGTTYFRVHDMGDNTTTSYTDNLADGSLTEDGSKLPYQTMFTTTPQIDAGDNNGGPHVPDGVYARRCFNGLAADAMPARGGLAASIDQVGSVNTGSDLTLIARTLQYIRPQERFLSPADMGA